jgi:hypothetical protein
MVSPLHELGCVAKLGLVLFVCCAILSMPGCGGSSSTTPPGITLSSISVSPLNQSVPADSTLQFTATGHYSDGTTQDITTTVTWSSSDTAVATISNTAGTNGLASGVAKGSTTIAATQGTPSGQTAFDVTEPITAIAITPMNPSVAAGIPQQFTATATYADNSTGDVTSTVTWSSSDTTKATISNVSAFNGVASTLAAGPTTIQASLSGTSNSTVLTVSAAAPVGLVVSPQNAVIADGGSPQPTLQFTALAQYSDGTTQDVTSSATWSSNNTSVATVAAGTATSLPLASGQTAGFASITASWTAPGSGAVVKKSKKAASTRSVKSQGVPAPFTATGVSILSVTLHTGNGFAGVFTQHNDISRTGQNTNETALATAVVGNTTTFGKLFKQTVDGQVYAQPLYVPNVNIAGVMHNVIYVATENDSVFAFDADSNTGANANPLWKVTLLDTAHGSGANAAPVNTGSSPDVRCGNIANQIGITSTPVIDPSTNTMYVAAESKEGTTGNYVFFQRLHALDITTGAEKSSASPVVVTATVPGTADGSTTVTFNPLMHLSRPGLLLVNGTVYIAYSSNCDNTPYHGWVFSYNAASFAQTGIYITTPNGGLGGIWMSGDGIAGDSNGNVYIASGNGDFDTVNVPAVETGDTVFKLNQRGSLLPLVDYFTPYDQDSLDTGDVDVGSGGVLLLPNQSAGGHPHMLVQAGKLGTIYLIDRDQMTTSNQHYCANCNSDPQIVQEVTQVISGGVWSMPAYWNNNIYYWGSGDSLTAFGLTNGLLSTLPTSTSKVSTTYPGSVPAVSANGTTNGIVWAIDPKNGSGTSAILHAFDATNVSTELYNTTMATGNRDQPGTGVKFSTPTIANGKVYIGTQTELDVYGLLQP